MDKLTIGNWAYIEIKNKYGERFIENFKDGTNCESWLYYFRELLLRLGFSEEEIKVAWRQW
jgi:hypothetical protein